MPKNQKLVLLLQPVVLLLPPRPKKPPKRVCHPLQSPPPIPLSQPPASIAHSFFVWHWHWLNRQKRRHQRRKEIKACLQSFSVIAFYISYCTDDGFRHLLRTAQDLWSARCCCVASRDSLQVSSFNIEENPNQTEFILIHSEHTKSENRESERTRREKKSNQPVRDERHSCAQRCEREENLDCG